MFGVLPKRKILMRHGKSQGNQDTATYITTPDHNIWSTTRGMAKVIRIDKHFRRVMGSDGCSLDWRIQFYVSPYAHSRSMLHELIQCFLKKRINGVRKELVLIDVCKPLKKVKRIKKSGGILVEVNFKYERLGIFCYVCGMMWHVEESGQKFLAMKEDDGA
ncbi:Phosphoglycerate mutase-like protein AT74 [Glycine max]|nr:Phosphoglycerate mutase-like protein AT74 [Glycine max]